ncbi:hypothetical protein J2T10_002631 [Paenarthrobacter nicotinovorans]|uniref:DUF4365 domain-containing protein n=1 Tax=Paenarthrobacter nicotinovorans TaxID=29320 RepID=A0ABT9TP18_PAENI|nr:hypothetical protein [Paenarthrobacter nicotinovorans]
MKTSRRKGPDSKYFKRVSKDGEGNVLGWWYYEPEGDEHFDYWTQHTAPHILVLHDLELGESYWVHVTKERLESAGKGLKILVPAHQLVDEAHNRQLIEVATSGRGRAEWEGSAWGGGTKIATADILRHALIVPRLVAPHRNQRPESFPPEQAIAALVLMRQADLQTTVPDVLARTRSRRWSWKLFSAIESYLQTGDALVFSKPLASARKPADRVAAACAWATALLEQANPTRALALIDDVIATDEASPQDHVWLLVQRARCLGELGRRDEAKKAALGALLERSSAPDDPTLTALCGAASWIVFSSTPMGARSIEEYIANSDSIASWWRAQVTAWGLSTNFDEQFRAWSRDAAPRVGFDDPAWNHLRASSLIAGLVGDQSGWAQSYARLAKLQLLRTDGETPADDVMEALTMLRLGGDHKAMPHAVRRVVLEGPAQAARLAAEMVPLEHLTRTTLRSSMELLKAAADVLSPKTADETARWCIHYLSDLQSFNESYAPAFYVPTELLKLLAKVVPSLSETGAHMLLDWLTTLPEQVDQLTAQGYASVIRAVGIKTWRQGDIEKLAARRAGDHMALIGAIDKLRATFDADYRASLVEDIAKGDHDALDKYGDVSALPSAAVQGMLQSLAKEVRHITDLAGGLVFNDGGYSPRTLALLNLWFPEQAEWDPLLEFLEEPRVSKDDLSGCLTLLGRTRLPITADKERLAAALRRLMTEKGGEGEWLFGEWTDVRGVAAEALSAVAPDALAEEDIWALMRGSLEQQFSAALILGTRGKPDELGLLVALSVSPDTSVKAAVANCLAGWISKGIARSRSSALLNAMLDNAGTELPRAVVGSAKGAPDDEGVLQIVERYSHHISASVRRSIQAIQEGGRQS